MKIVNEQLEKSSKGCFNIGNPRRSLRTSNRKSEPGSSQSEEAKMVSIRKIKATLIDYNVNCGNESPKENSNNVCNNLEPSKRSLRIAKQKQEKLSENISSEKKLESVSPKKVKAVSKRSNSIERLTGLKEITKAESRRSLCIGKRKQQKLSESISSEKKVKAVSKRSNSIERLTGLKEITEKESRRSLRIGKRKQQKLSESISSEKKVKAVSPMKVKALSESSNSIDRLPGLKEITKKESNSCGKTKSKQKEQTSYMFDKYKIKTPSLEEMLDCQKKLQQIEKTLEELNLKMNEFDKLDVNFNEIDEVDVKENVIVLDCKNVNEDELKEYFNKYHTYISELYNGTCSSNTSEKFKKCYRVQELNRSITYMFTYEQKKLLYSLLHEKFGNENFMTTFDKYFFQVLLPELCMKIFMEQHEMTYEEATKYLKDVPVTEIV